MTLWFATDSKEARNPPYAFHGTWRLEGSDVVYEFMHQFPNRPLELKRERLPLDIFRGRSVPDFGAIHRVFQ
jgi:hypothetical protein